MYKSVLDKERQDLRKADMNRGIRKVGKAYSRIKNNSPATVVNYEDSSLRFAYIYKFAVCHTAIVRKHVELLKSTDYGFEIFQEMLRLDEGQLNLCSLGGGPGCEVVGILSQVDQKARKKLFNVDCKILDLCDGWSQSLRYVMEAFLKSNLGKNYESRLNCSFIKTDLCSVLDSVSTSAIEEANLVTMVKFVSALPQHCSDSSNCLQEIFRLMKPGSHLLFLDNCSGGFYEMVSMVAKENDLVPLFLHKTPYKRGKDFKFSKYKFSVKPLHSTSVIFAIWKKLGSNDLLTYELYERLIRDRLVITE